ncbi:glycerophosphodiester phosphodiesterase family protein [Aureimonas sp. AU40]|uniref:glycerophosphodiester phosphodiesterase family protein n=1 Tax=Aureimonas sp. AU40 TaxID=1637747 RepID=UPI00078170B5|nr:glycerophosphodiester phosphodiesterase family protein [Aureimonas sp. AU40]
MTSRFAAPAAEPLSLRSPVLDFDPADILVIAHRGSWARAPENSIQAIRDAIALGVGMVEIDVRQAADGAMVVIHDDTLDRTTEGTGPVRAETGEAIRRMRLRERGGDEGAALTEERVPSLFEALEEARGRVLVNIDTKSVSELPAVSAEILSGGFSAGVVVKAELKSSELAQLPTDHPAFGPLPFMPVVVSAPQGFAGDLAALAPLSPFMIECKPHCVADLETGMEVARTIGARIWLNTLDVAHMTDFNDTAAMADADAIWGRLLDLGVGAMQTDESQALVAYLAGRGLKSARP